MVFTRHDGARASLMIAASTLALAYADAAHAQTRQFDVPAQPAATGVPAFARQAELQILAPADAVAGRRTAAVQGVYTVDQGLSRLLEGSNLVVTANDGRTAVLAASQPISAAVTDQSPASQPQEDVAEVDTIVVTGFRASLQSALNLKRRDAGIIDAIKAEDIAEFPDLNLAESLQRIPGVAITRVAGEGRQISVRGLGPDYTRVRVNGMEALATSGGTDSGGAVGNNRSRGFDFNTFASELFNSLVVRKTASANVEEGSLGAVVDLNTSRPFDYAKPTFAISAQLGTNDLSRSTDPRLAVLASKQWMDGRFGALFSAAWSRRNQLEEGHGTTQWAAIGGNGGFAPGSMLPGFTSDDLNDSSTTALFLPRNPSYNSYDQTDERLGITASLQFRPTDRTLVSVNGLYGKLETVRDEYLLQALSFILPRTGKPETIIRNGEVEGRNVAYGEFDNVDMRAQSGHHELETTFKQVTADFEHQFTDRFSINGLIGRAESNFAQPIATTVTIDRNNIQNYVYDYRVGRAPLITFDMDPTDPASWTSVNGFSEVRLRPEWVDNVFTMARIEGKFDVNESLTLRGGVDRRKFEFESRQQRRIAGETVSETLSPDQLASMTKLFSGFGRNLDLPDGVATAWLVPDIQRYVDDLGIYSNTGIYAVGTVENSSARGATGGVTEEDTGVFGMAEFQTQLFNLPVRGDLGVRYVKTDQTSTGYAATSSTIEIVSAQRSYDYTLPSLNLSVELTPDLQLRFGAAKTIARAGLGSLSPGGNVSVQGVGGANRSFSTGNPDLEPTESTNLDLSLEWYPQQGAIYALGLFSKDISTFAQTLRVTARYDTLGLSPDLIAGTGALPTDDFEVTRPVNTEGGDLTGFEINIQQPLTFLPGWLSNLGVLANYTYVKSDIDYLTSTTPGTPTIAATLVGLSKNAANATLYYETDRFSLRGSVAYRSGYLTQVPGPNGSDVAGTNETLNFDMQASYNINDHLEVSVEGLNLTDEFNDRYVDSSNRVWVYAHTGRQFYLGLRYRY